MLQSFATVATNNTYVRPTNTAGTTTLNVKGGHSPVVTTVLGQDSYIPNDVLLDRDTDMLHITGPNMSGLSTYMRQLDYIVLLAQAGSFVPAHTADLPILHQIFTRLGAAEHLANGTSTFMVEMYTANAAYSTATDSSYILLHTIGRGTAT